MQRRVFTHGLVRAATAFGLLAAVAPRRALATGMRSTVDTWLGELGELVGDLRGRRLDDLGFQDRIDRLLAQVDLADLAAAIDLDALLAATDPPGRGAAGLDLGLGALLPAGLGLRTRLFVCRKGRSIVPHGHLNLCTGALVLRGRWRARHYDRLESRGDFHVLRPTSDREIAPGDVSTVSDHRDNVHWFEATSDLALLFNAHVAGYDPRLRGSPGRIYLDPAGPLRGDGLLDAPTMTRADCLAKYG